VDTDGTARARLRVLILSDRSLFGEGIEGLLRQEPGLEIVGLDTDPGKAMQCIRETRPDVVILTDGEAATGIGFELLRLVREGFPMRIVELDLATNSLCIYCGEQETVTEVRDLADAVGHICHSVRGETQVPLPPTTGGRPPDGGL
jgi:chemotaxis response regulator CheB